MKITITLREILDRGSWDAFCDLKGWNPWCINEGRADGDEEVTLTLEEAREIGVQVESLFSER